MYLHTSLIDSALHACWRVFLLAPKYVTWRIISSCHASLVYIAPVYASLAQLVTPNRVTLRTQLATSILRQPMPPYLAIANAIKAQIDAGELAPGDQVPSMARISEQYSVSRGTARRVLVTLREWGLVEITPGWGTFVK
jgi:hypothetical protein